MPPLMHVVTKTTQLRNLLLPKDREEVQKIVEVLKESNPEVSQFVEILEKVNVADLTQDELTVFAVKNTSITAEPCCRIGYRFHQKSHRQRTLCQRGFNRWQYPDQVSVTKHFM